MRRHGAAVSAATTAMRRHGAAVSAATTAMRRHGAGFKYEVKCKING